MKKYFKIDPEIPSSITIEENETSVRVTMNDCTDKIHWWFRKNQEGKKKLNEVFQALYHLKNRL